MFLIKKNVPAANRIEYVIVLCFEYSIVPVKLKIINVKANAIKTPDSSINNLFLLFNMSNALTPSISGFHFKRP
jgi:hypothetical protein